MLFTVHTYSVQTLLRFTQVELYKISNIENRLILSDPISYLQCLMDLVVHSLMWLYSSYRFI